MEKEGNPVNRAIKIEWQYMTRYVHSNTELKLKSEGGRSSGSKDYKLTVAGMHAIATAQQLPVQR
jgi:hypothetical protein